MVLTGVAQVGAARARPIASAKCLNIVNASEFVDLSVAGLTIYVLHVDPEANALLLLWRTAREITVTEITHKALASSRARERSTSQ
jgi:hypothetical protein